MNDLIKQAAEEAAKETVMQLKKQGMLKDNKRTPFQKVETLLYNYNDFNKVVKEKEEQIELLKKEPIQIKSKSITAFSTQPRYDEKNDVEKKVDEIERIEDSIRVTRNLLKTIDATLELIKEDKYFDIIKMKYFEGKTQANIAEYFNRDEKTITRNKNRLINILRIHLFSDECIEEIFA